MNSANHHGQYFRSRQMILIHNVFQKNNDEARDVFHYIDYSDYRL